MGVTDITWPIVITVIGFLLCVFSIYNTYSSARHNYKRFIEEKNQPIEKINKALANDKARLDNHEAILNNLQRDAKDTQEGLNVIGKGVQALLDGSNEKREKAKDDLNQWVWDGRKPYE